MFHASVALPRKVVLYIPQSRQGKLKGWSEALAKAAGWLSERFEFGYWQRPSGELVKEPVAVLTAFYGDERVMDVGTAVDRIVDELLTDGEDAVLVEWDGLPRLIEEHA